MCDASRYCERAQWEILIPKGLISLSLYFCDHHFRQHQLQLISNEYEIRAHRDIPVVDMK